LGKRAEAWRNAELALYGAEGKLAAVRAFLRALP